MVKKKIKDLTKEDFIRFCHISKCICNSCELWGVPCSYLTMKYSSDSEVDKIINQEIKLND